MSFSTEISGQKFGRLTAIKNEGYKNGSAQWLCKCDCGGEKVVSCYSLKSGATKSCGCIRKEGKDYTGMKFGSLTAIERVERPEEGAAFWLCKCECGTLTVVRSASLVSGNTKSCGCLRKNNYIDNMIGQKFGRLTVTKCLGMKKRNSYFLCECECGSVCEVIGTKLKRGEIRSCGCLMMDYQNRANDLTGERFGRWTVLSKKDVEKTGTHYFCQCDCGTQKVISRSTLIAGNTTSCGCKFRNETDLTGQKFGRLTALEFLNKKSKKGLYLWKCICDCGNVIEAETTRLVKNKIKSCGCINRELTAEKLMERFKHDHVEGTRISIISNDTLRIDNKTGIRGVCVTAEGEILAYIGFKGKTYRFSGFHTIEQAAIVRKKAEEYHFESFLEEYYNNKSKNTSSP